MFAPVAASAADIASPTPYICPIAVLYSLTSHHARAEIKSNEIQMYLLTLKFSSYTYFFLWRFCLVYAVSFLL
jgi:hypothetical protein